MHSNKKLQTLIIRLAKQKSIKNRSKTIVYGKNQISGNANAMKILDFNRRQQVWRSELHLIHFNIRSE